MHIILATAPKPFIDPHIATIQWNALQSWLCLGEQVTVLFIGDEPGMAEVASKTNVVHIENVAKSAGGTPLISSIFDLMRQYGESQKYKDGYLLVLVNADIILLPDFVAAVNSVVEQSNSFLVVGPRWDMDITEKIDFTPGWQDQLLTEINEHGKPHPPVGSDFFVFPNDIFQEVPDFSIGRSGWDNWMIFKAREQGWQVVDLTLSINVIHQNHDYHHLPGGKPPYRHPETLENIRLAGGNQVIFNLADASHELVYGQIKTKPFGWKKFWRELEIFPSIKLRSRILANIFYIIFHPIKKYKEFRGRLSYWVKKIMRPKEI